MNAKLLAISVIALLVLPSVPIAFSMDISVENTGNHIIFKTSAQDVADNIIFDNSTSVGGNFDAVVQDPENNPNEITIENNGKPTITKGDVNFDMQLPENERVLICLKGVFNLLNQYTFYVDIDGVRYTGTYVAINSSQTYFYPSTTSPGQLESTQDFTVAEQHYFSSNSAMSFHFEGQDNTPIVGTALNVSILLEPKI